MPDERRPAYWEPPEAGVGGEGPIVDETVLAPTTDAEIERAVHTALSLDPDVEADRFVVTVEDGVVQLAGHPRSDRERRRAVEVAGLVHAVRRVVERFAD
jgi:osmotically-inducible protein OsmY